MVSAVDGLFATVLLLGVVICALGVFTYHRRDQLGVTPLVAFAVILGLGKIVTALVGVAGLTVADEPAVPLWTQIAFLSWIFAAVPWFLFSLQYTGRYTRIRWRVAGLLHVPAVGIGLNIVLTVVGFGSLALFQVVATTVLLYYLTLVLVGAALVVYATYNNVHIPVREGMLLVVLPIVVFTTINMVSAVPAGTIIGVAVYTTGLGIGAVSFGYVVWHGVLFEYTPAVETIGEQAIARETDDLVFVVDDSDSVVKLNATAVETLGVSRTEALGEPLTELLEHSTQQLDGLTTVSLETVDGARQYDPQVSTVTDDNGTELGAVLGLRDVTERELREQRLTVLNRVLRHNLRNKIEIVKSHAEVIDAEHGTDHAVTISETADSIADLGRSARHIDQFVAESTADRRVDVVALVDDVLERVGADEADLSVSVETPAELSVVTNHQALDGALGSAIENAVAYADSAVSIEVVETADGCNITIEDDGPGIPDNELESLDSGTETPLQHGTGLGLWQLKWAVTTLNGELSFDTADGTTVEISVPDRN